MSEEPDRAFLQGAVERYGKRSKKPSKANRSKWSIASRHAHSSLLARDDDLCKIEGYEKLYKRAREPKKLVVLPITHYEIYGGKRLAESSRLACGWLERFLK